MLYEEGDVCRTHTVCPFVIVSGVDLKTLVHPIEYAPFTTEMIVAVSIPLIVTGSDVRTELKGTPVCATKLNASGVVSVNGTAPTTAFVTVTGLSYDRTYGTRATVLALAA